MPILFTTNSDSLQNWFRDLKEFQLDNMFDTQILARAYLLTEAITIEDHKDISVDANMREKPYKMKVWTKNNKVFGECTCPYDGPCKHLAALLLKLLSK